MDNSQIEYEEGVVYIILSGLLLLVLVVVLTGALLPRIRTKTKQCILNTPVDVVFAIVTNNQEWYYRSSFCDWRSSVLKEILRNGKRLPMV